MILLGRHADRIARAQEFRATDLVSERGEEAAERAAPSRAAWTSRNSWRRYGLWTRVHAGRVVASAALIAAATLTIAALKPHAPAIALLVLAFLGIHRHYRKIARRLRAGTDAVRSAGVPRNQVIIVPDTVDDATETALWYARRIANGDVRAVNVPGHGTHTGIQGLWFRLAGREPHLEQLDPTEGRIDPVLEELWKLPRGERDVVTVVIPEQFRRRSLLAAARRTSFRLKLRLLSEPGVVVADVPAISDKYSPDGHTPTTLITRILVADVHAASVRAVNYAQCLNADDLRAVSFSAQPEEARALEAAWRAAGITVALEILEAPYRDIGDPLLSYLRELTADPDAAVNVVMPELVLHGWRRILHNQRALYIKRLLLFEPGVILTSVPYQLLR